MAESFTVNLTARQAALIIESAGGSGTAQQAITALIQQIVRSQRRALAQEVVRDAVRGRAAFPTDSNLDVQKLAEEALRRRRARRQA